MVNPQTPTRYVTGSPVITTTGLYGFREANLRSAQRWLERGTYVSRIQHEILAEAVEMLVGVRPPVEHVENWVFMKPGDEALCFHFRAGVDFSALKPTDISPDFVKRRVRIGVLTRIE